MNQDCYKFISSYRERNLSLIIQRAGDDYNVLCTGGDKPHIGAVCIGYPQIGEIRADRVELPGHREGVLAEQIARMMASRLNHTVVVSCGLHYDRITKTEITELCNIVLEFCDTAVSSIAQ